MRIRTMALWVMVTLFVPATTFGQASGSIAGTVRDTSGAVLPGVTVEAGSPALIERVRSVITDDQGNYKIVDLRTGVYTVTITLTGFSTFKREGIELSAGFTANVSAELKVGSLEETVVVTGGSPIVDVQNARTQTVFSNETLAALPQSRTLGAYVNMMPGVQPFSKTGWGTRDIGGAGGEPPQGMRSHGSPPGITSFDGFPMANLLRAAERRIMTNQNSLQEVVVESGGGLGETMTGGVNLNVIGKDGGNRFSGSFFGTYTPSGWDTGNISDDLRARGLTSYNKQIDLWDLGAGIGGPLKKDKLWYFVSPRWWGNENEVAGLYFNKPELANTVLYQPDLTRPATAGRDQRDVSGRLTWQVAARHKLVFSTYNTLMDFKYSTVGEGFAEPSGGFNFFYGPVNNLRAQWTHPATSRLLFDAGLVVARENTSSKPVAGSLPTDRTVFEVSLGKYYGSSGIRPYLPTSRFPWAHSLPVSAVASVSYTTGSHSFKAGFMSTTGGQYLDVGAPNYPESYTFFNQVPISLTQALVLDGEHMRMRLRLGVYGQDQWTIRRVTINAALRYDGINGASPAQDIKPQTYLPNGLQLAEVNDIPNWKAVHPRVGMAWDVFGTGKTAVKGAIGRYEITSNYDVQLTAAMSPFAGIVASTTRTWSDGNRNYVPDCDLTSRAANGECGPMANQAFGTTLVRTRYADDVRTGWGASPYTWQGHVTLQQELFPRTGLTVSYYRTSYGNISVTDNLAVTPADFSPYCITAPVDPRLPGGGGYQVCGLYDVSPAKFGQVDNLIRNSEALDRRTQVFNGFDVLLNARFGRGGLVYGGISTGQMVTNNCPTPDVPTTPFCRETSPWKANTDVKASVVYPLPWWGLQTSVVYQNISGISRTANYVASNAQIAPSLGRNLASCGAAATCAATVTVPLVAPNTLFENRGNQVDLRFSKILKLNDVHRLQANFEVFNLTNAGDPTNLVGTFGSSWLFPNGIITGRLFKWSVQFSF